MNTNLSLECNLQFRYSKAWEGMGGYIADNGTSHPGKDQLRPIWSFINIVQAHKKLIFIEGQTMKKSKWEWIPCPACSGSGATNVITIDGEVEQCEDCDGTGEIAHHLESGTLAAWPGGPFRGRSTTKKGDHLKW